MKLNLFNYRTLQRIHIRCPAHLFAKHLRGVRQLSVSLLLHLQHGLACLHVHVPALLQRIRLPAAESHAPGLKHDATAHIGKNERNPQSHPRNTLLRFLVLLFIYVFIF